MNIAPTTTRFSPPNPALRVVRFGNETPPEQPKAPEAAPPATEEKPSFLQKAWGAVQWLFKAVAQGIAYALGFELTEGLVHKVFGFGGHGN